LILALGNTLLQDDGVGAELLSLIEPIAGTWGPAVELLDGGTCGLALLGEVQGRDAVVFLDAVKLEAAPGSVHVIDKAQLLGMGPRTSKTAHEGGATEILAAAQLLGSLPEKVVVIGVEPEVVATGIGLSPSVKAGLSEALGRVVQFIDEVLVEDRHVSGNTRKDH
jgi:hydrogenase maturation protease